MPLNLLVQLFIGHYTRLEFGRPPFGSIRGIDEKFAANPVNGSGSMSVPLALSPGRAAFGPQLELSYDSLSGNGVFGFGWTLSLPSITRKTDKGLPRYLDPDRSDVFVLAGAEDLVPSLVADQASLVAFTTRAVIDPFWSTGSEGP